MAFVSENPTAEAERLMAAGTSFHSEIKRPGAHLILLQDPWGIGLQLCRRGMQRPALRLGACRKDARATVRALTPVGRPGEIARPRIH